MDKMTKDEFKESMRIAKIEEEIKMSENIIGDAAAAYFAHDSEADIDMEPELPKRKPGRPKKETAETKKPGRKPKEKTETAPKKPERKPKTEKPQVAAEPTESRHEDEMDSLRFLIGVARGRTSEIIHNAEAHIKTGQKLTDLAEVYDTHIRRVEEMLK